MNYNYNRRNRTHTNKFTHMREHIQPAHKYTPNPENRTQLFQNNTPLFLSQNMIHTHRRRSLSCKCAYVMSDTRATCASNNVARLSVVRVSVFDWYIVIFPLINLILWNILLFTTIHTQNQRLCELMVCETCQAHKSIKSIAHTTNNNHSRDRIVCLILCRREISDCLPAWTQHGIKT